MRASAAESSSLVDVVHQWPQASDITETYAFLPREAVTKFLLQCTDCQRRPTVTDNSSASPSPPPLPLLPIAPAPGATPAAPVINNAVPQQLSHSIASIAAHPPPALPPAPIPALITAVSESTPTPIPAPREPSPPMTLGSHCGITSHPYTGGRLDPPDIDFSLPITTTYLKHMRSLGYTDEDALKIDVDKSSADSIMSSHPAKRRATNKDVSTPEPDGNDEDQYSGRNGDLRLDDPRDLPSEDGALWGGYHGLGLKKGAREQSSPVGDRGTTHETSSVHDETSSSGNKEDDDDDDDDAEDKIDSQQYDPERLKAFNMFVRLFVDENLDRMVPISKQPKEKIQAIIDSCTRQFPEFAERARKRIRTYLKSCRRTKRTRDQNGWDSSRPTPAHLTSVQAEQILAQACENESHNAKRMRLGLEPVSQPMPVAPSERPPVDHFSSMVKSESVTTDSHSISALTSYAKMDTNNTVNSQSATTPPKSLAVTPVTSAASLNGSAVVTSAAATPGAPTTLYRPNFRPTDLSMKNTTKPLLSHKLNSAEMAAVRQLITGYRESAAFLLRSADELEQLLLQQQ
ncbi:hypothetical protein B566_EDAN002920 [Ephemera danica]|nr:hypothetical protein B566_EDAN002920 [Ephemera danica]